MSDRSWYNRQLDDGDVHILPRDDLVEHELSIKCVCRPKTDPVKRDDGSIGYLYIHNSLDGREASE